MSPTASQPVKPSAPDTALWEQLFALMARIKALAPWDWMEESDLFGVQHPDTGDLGFVSIMGMAGEHYSVGLYLGALGLAGFWEMEDNAPMIAPERLLEIPQLQASFEDRDQLDKKDRDLIKSLNVKFRGPACLASVSQLSAWIVSLVPGGVGSTVSLYGARTGSRCGASLPRQPVAAGCIGR